MMGNVDIQIVWNENKGEVQLFIGDFRIGLPPVLCEQLEKELAAARRVPERARQMARPKYTCFHCKAVVCEGEDHRHDDSSSDTDAITDRATIAMGGDAVTSNGA